MTRMKRKDGLYVEELEAEAGAFHHAPPCTTCQEEEYLDGVRGEGIQRALQKRFKKSELTHYLVPQSTVAFVFHSRCCETRGRKARSPEMRFKSRRRHSASFCDRTKR